MPANANILSLVARRRVGGVTPPSLSHLLITGQSLAVGSNGIPVVSTAQPDSNLMFAGGVRAPDDELDSLIPLVAASEADPISGTDGETIANGMADELSRPKPVLQFLVSCAGLNGARYDEIKKGTATYDLALAQIQAGFDLADPGIYRGVLAIVTCHGEADQAFNVANYDVALAEWQDDFDTDIKGITSQTADVPLLVYQQCSSAPSGADSAATATALESLKAHEDNPGKVVLVGPNYPWLRSDGIHLTPHGYRSMGVMYANVLRVLRAGGTWSPLRPILIERTNEVIDVTFHVPVPPIAFDIARVFNPGNYGFSFKDDDDSAAIASVAIVAADKVRITLDGTPTGANKLIRYGWTNTSWSGGGGPSGPLGSARGNLRDAGYDEVNRYGYDSFNWGVLFSKPVS